MVVLENDLLAAISNFPSRPNTSWKERVQHCLTQLEKPWLLILDDACVDALNELHSLLPKYGPGLVVVNTATRHSSIFRFESVTLPCRNFTVQEAVSLLQRITEDFNSKETYEDIARRLNYLPFALDIAGTCMKNMNLGGMKFSPRSCLNTLKRETHEFFTYTATRNTSKTSVGEVISAAVRQVQEEFDSNYQDMTWSVQDVLQLLSFFVSENIPLEIMPFNEPSHVSVQSTQEVQTDWVRRHVEAIAGVCYFADWSTFHWRTLMDLLHEYHLLDRLKRGSATTYSMHSLLLDWAHDTLRQRPDHFTVLKVTAATILASARIFHGKTTPERTVLLSQLHPHWEACLSSTLRTQDGADDEIIPASPNEIPTMASSKGRAVQDMLFEHIEILKARGRSREVINWCQALLHIRLKEHHDCAVLESRTQLSECQEFLGDHRKALYERRAVLDYLEGPKGNQMSDNHLPAVLDVAKSLTVLANYDEAYQLLQAELLVPQKRCKDPDAIQLELVHKRLGIVCQRTGRFGEAIEIRKALVETLKSKEYPEDRAEMLDAKTNLAYSYLGGSELQKKYALDLHREVAASEKQNLPDDHPRVILAMENLAWSLILSDMPKNLEEAHELLINSLALRNKYAGAEDAGTIKARIRLAVCKIHMNKPGRCEQACHEIKMCLQHHTLQIGIDNETRLWAMQELAGVYLRRTEPPLPRLCYTGLAIRILIYETYLINFGADNLHMIIPTKHVASALERVGCWQAALPFRAQVVRYLRSSGEAADERCLWAEHCLAVNLGNSPHLEHQKEAKRLFHDVLDKAKLQGSAGLTAKMDLATFAMSYIYFLQDQCMFEEAGNVILELLGDPACLIRFQQEDLDELKNLQVDCNKRSKVEADSSFAFHERVQKRKSFKVNMVKDCSDFSNYKFSACMRAIFQWEKHAAVTIPDPEHPIPHPLPWRDPDVAAHGLYLIGDMAINPRTRNKADSLVERIYEALVVGENSTSLTGTKQMGLLDYRNTMRFNSGRGFIWDITVPVFRLVCPYTLWNGLCAAFDAMLAAFWFLGGVGNVAFNNVANHFKNHAE